MGGQSQPASQRQSERLALADDDHPLPAHGSTAKMAAASHPPPRPLLLRLLTLALALAGAAAGKVSGPRTPISRDIYHSSDSLLREIKALVSRHSDKLSIDTIRTSNKGYSAELSVVTFNHVKESVDNGSKVHILLKGSLSSRALGSMAENLLPLKLRYIFSIF